ncbi:YdiU domain protein [Aspergillus saccharolyticus JOP 1030-1]|uniref:Selenoprotein O n=1 Tax=Aspergillus saccharolyticus JOP 1030-1 TaxID=1450539 RepID=A0A318Z2G9_9EURO|nr:YdiU domain protein [Aspergillus saccharolyticus JOP 1030-1]PYH41169.1 YdiU domain protein [Aspergillus saccharolyticus JOP 1030-1]
MVVVNARSANLQVQLASFCSLFRRSWTFPRRFFHMASSLRNNSKGVSLHDIPKSSVFTSKLPADPAFETPEKSHRASRETLGPRLVRGALYTFVRPEPAEDYEILGVSPKALDDLGIARGEENTPQFRALVSGNDFPWDETTGGIYPWAQCYGGWQFGSWAGQLGDGRAISLFESTNPYTNIRYELQLKGAGRTPYSRFADGKAVLRSSIREFIVSEALSALGIPTTRALAITLLPQSKVLRERIEPGAIVTRFAESWLRIGTFDLLRARGDRDLTRRLATYVAEEVFNGWETLDCAIYSDDGQSLPAASTSSGNSLKDEVEEHERLQENRFTRLYREIARRNAKTVAAWQAYGFMNGVLNTDNTSIYGLSMDFGPFAFMDNFDPHYTPNHDDHLLRYSYKNQPSVIWWNLVRLGESLGELMGAGDRVDHEDFVKGGLTEDSAPAIIERAEKLIERTGKEFRAVFLNEYKTLMRRRLGLQTEKETDFQNLFSEMLDMMEALELDFNHFFRKLSNIPLQDIETTTQRIEMAPIFFHNEGLDSVGLTESAAKERIAHWLEKWRTRILEDWGMDDDTARQMLMKSRNPSFLPRGWILDEVIERVERKGDRGILGRILHMTTRPFEDEWGFNREEEQRFCGDVPKIKRAMMCSCSS